MGTRHLIRVVEDGKNVVAQYGQWDGYPSGQGIDILNFLKKADMSIFREKLAYCRYITKEALAQKTDALFEEYLKGLDDPKRVEHERAMKEAGMISWDFSSKVDAKYPTLSRDVGAAILQMIYDSEEEVILIDSSDFAKDTLYCEYEYEINLDKETFSCVSGNRKVFLYSLGKLPDASKLTELD